MFDEKYPKRIEITPNGNVITETTVIDNFDILSKELNKESKDFSISTGDVINTQLIFRVGFPIMT